MSVENETPEIPSAQGSPPDKPENGGKKDAGQILIEELTPDSGGGGGASDVDSGVDSGSGARGAGIVMIFADTITVSGTLTANGADVPSTPAGGDNGMGGGGSGLVGSIWPPTPQPLAPTW